MPTYITFIKWTEEGIKTVKDVPKRVERGRNALKSIGGELKAQYFTFGRYDTIVIAEAPNDEAMAKQALIMGSFGAANAETLKAFTEIEFYEIIKGLP